MANNSYNDKQSKYSIKTVTLATVDRTVRDYFDKKLNITVDSDSGSQKVRVIFASRRKMEAN